jgi:hypothetical protein
MFAVTLLGVLASVVSSRQITAVLTSDLQHRLRKRVARDFSWGQIYRRGLAPLLEGAQG